MSSIFDLFKRIEKKREEDVIRITHIIAGLGNPGPGYARTRHNCGFIALDRIASETGIKIDRARFDALTGDGRIEDKRVLLIKPLTFMNLSGKAIAQAADFYKIPPESVIVIHDDAALNLGAMRTRITGSDGGHNGIRSVIEELGTQEFPRIKIGIGEKPDPDYDIKDWVLGKFTDFELEKINERAADCRGAVKYLLAGEVEKAMGAYNRK